MCQRLQFFRILPTRKGERAGDALIRGGVAALGIGVLDVFDDFRGAHDDI